jgi:hypothetical protein
MLKIAGALHKTTNVYTTPSNAIKGEKYKCFECNDDIIFKKGVKVIPHFSHKPKSNCSYFSNGESDEHKNAKIILKYIIDNNIPLFINRQCGLCNDIKEYSIFKVEASSIQLEHRFEYNGLKIADVAMIKDGDISYVFEILKTHKTKEEDRYGEWFEINAEDLIDSYTNYIDKINLICAREYCKKCNDCNIQQLDTIEFFDKKKEIKLLNNIFYSNGNIIHDDEIIFYNENIRTMRKNCKNKGCGVIHYQDKYKNTKKIEKYRFKYIFNDIWFCVDCSNPCSSDMCHRCDEDINLCKCLAYICKACNYTIVMKSYNTHHNC